MLKKKLISIIKFHLIVLYTMVSAQNLHQGEITFDYSGTVSGSFFSSAQDSLTTGFAFNQEGIDTSYFVIGAISEQEEGIFDLFFALIQDTIFPVQPRIWNIPGQGDEGDPLSLETVVVLMPGVDSTLVVDLFSIFSNVTANDSLNLDTLVTGLFLELSSNFYLGLAGELEISDITDSTLSGGFYSTLVKPEIHIPPHMIMVNNGEFIFNEVSLSTFATQSMLNSPEKLNLYPAYPNPFNPVTNIIFSIDQYSNGSLHIFDINGRMIETLFNRRLSPGEYKIEWDAGSCSNGVYFAMLKTKNYFKTTKLVLLK
ncbi:MAG: hypothetical protein CMG74_08610 [Candidatus Marinimicrobia bacterium]|nr:hypothetical protein [Candidatus Neomarinimicrobiota bacterium]